MSGTFNYMATAIAELKEKYPERKITICDTENISLGAGMVVYYAAKLHNEGASDEEVASFVEDFKNRSKCYFTVADLTYLKRGGRVSSFKAFMGTLLDLKPQLVVEDGTLTNFEKSKGRKRSIKDLVSYMENEGVDENYPVYAVHADSEDDVQILISILNEKYPSLEIKKQLIGPVIGSHCGPDTIGLVFVKKA
jgi:DegV family protein with EDD domain